MLTLTRPDTINIKAKFFKGFSDPTRMAILETLRTGSRTVGDIVTTTGLGQSNVSNHLACLKGCGLVASEKRGRYVHYGLSDPRIAAILTLSEDLLAEVARGVYECTRDPSRN
jgi:DNA-binding transcriptional ArsR family regulator